MAVVIDYVNEANHSLKARLVRLELIRRNKLNKQKVASLTGSLNKRIAGDN